MREENKRWLMSMMKTSGSQRTHLRNGRFSEERHLAKQYNLEDLPQRESIKSTIKVSNGKINFGPLIRFLRNKNGCNWDEVYAEIVSRIPTKLLDYKEFVFWFVATKVEFIDGKPWNKETQRFIWTGEEIKSVHYTEIKSQPEFTEFYVHPETNNLVYIQQKSYKKLLKPSLKEDNNT